MTGTFYNRMTLTLAAGETRQVNAYGRYFRILGNTIATDPMVIIGDQAGEQKVSSGLGLELPVDPASDNSFARLLIRNPSGSAMVLDLAISSGKIDDSRLSVSGSITIQDGGNSITVDNADLTAAAASVASIKTDTRSINGDTGTQISKVGTASTSTTVLHTVTSGKTFYLTAAFLAIAYGTSYTNATLFITNAADTTVGTIARGYSTNATAGIPVNVPFNFSSPIKVPAGYKIKINASGGDESAACIQGWEE